MCVASCLYMNEMNAGSCRGQRKTLFPLELVTVVWRHLTWVLGTELQSSTRAVCTKTTEPFLLPLMSFYGSGLL